MDTRVKAVVDGLFPTPAWLPQAIDPGHQWVRLVRFSLADYREASFLDQRGLVEGAQYAVLAWDDIAGAIPAEARRDAHYIFHMGRVGSTLISRLLAECGPILPVREPRLLELPTLLPPTEAGRALFVLRTLFARTFTFDQHAMVKANSALSEIAADLVGPAEDGSRAVMITMGPSSFVAARLTDTTGELENRARGRFERLRRIAPDVGWAEASSTPARLAAMSWAAEATAINRATDAIGSDRARTVDFDRFLNDVIEGLASLSEHFGLKPGETELAAITNGPIIQRYSKRTEFAFSPAERERRISEAAAAHRDEIMDALRWLDRAATSSPAIGTALGRFGD